MSAESDLLAQIRANQLRRRSSRRSAPATSSRPARSNPRGRALRSRLEAASLAQSLPTAIPPLPQREVPTIPAGAPVPVEEPQQDISIPSFFGSGIIEGALNAPGIKQVLQSPATAAVLEKVEAGADLGFGTVLNTASALTNAAGIQN